MTATHFALLLALAPQASLDRCATPPDVIVPSVSQQVERLRSHYAAVVSELRAADTSRLTNAQRDERERLLEVLREFGECAEFGRNVDFPGARVPYFRTALGLRCAVAELMHASGEDEFVERIRAERNHVWICDLAGEPTFEAWLSRSGLSLEDAGRIHGPPIIDTGGGASTPGGPSSSGGSAGPSGGSYRGPGDTTSPSTGGGGGPSTPAGRGGSTPSGGGGGGTRTGGGGVGPSDPAGGGSNPGTPRPMTLVTTNDDTWWLWWEYNKSEFMRPNRLSLSNAPMTGDDADNLLRAAVAQARRSAIPVFEKALTDGDANIRATAAVALGRVGGSQAVLKLLDLLDDPNVEVRHKAILALGATGSAEALTPLLSIAKHGALDAESRSRISSAARPLAIVAMGLGRRREFDDRIDVEIAKLIQDRTRADRDPVGVAALVYAALAPCKELEGYALRLAKDESESPSVRCRAIESLRASQDESLLSDMQTFLSGPRLDLRRSAALALGEFDNPLALPALMTAYELESEPLTRGFVLISIGKQGGPRALDYLTKVIEKGDGGMRRWAALALGILARDVADRDVAARIGRTIQSACARERNQESMGAYWLASGLARDENARPNLRAALETAADARQRMYAASALALIGGDASLAVLRERLKVEAQPVVRVGIADALGILGEAQDVPAILEMLMNLNQPALQGLAASAMSANGSSAALVALSDLARADTGSNIRRAAAIEGLGMILAPVAPLVLADVSREANYTVFNEWIAAVFQTTL